MRWNRNITLREEKIDKNSNSVSEGRQHSLKEERDNTKNLEGQ